MDRKKKAVAIWLIAGAVMIVIQTLLGGVTRLTGSGLSITKWDPIFGILPPLSQKAWQDAFDSYKQIGQYKFLNSSFTLVDFKQIFFWEWLHRVWARMLGIVFITGFAYFLVRKYFDQKMVRPFIILFFLGGLQGVIGILMVKSGVNPEDVHVNYLWLAAHFIAAMILACYTLWFALILLVPEQARISSKPLWNMTFVTIILLLAQLKYGAFMAGLKAASAAPTWPDINGVMVPETLSTNGWLSDNNLGALMLNVHFVHRTLAYIIMGFVIIWAYMAGRVAKNAGADVLISKYRWLPFVAVIAQIALGIFAVLNATHIQPGKFGTFELIAEAHQLVAMFLLLSLVTNLYLVKRS